MKLDARALANFHDRVADLRECISAFDSAQWDNIDLKRRKAVNMAAYIYVLANNTKMNPALISQVHLKDQIRVPDTALVASVAGREQTSLKLGLGIVSAVREGVNILPVLTVIHVLTGHARIRGLFLPRLDAIQAAPTVSLAEWWTRCVGFNSAGLKRHELCSIIRSKDGIGHSDPFITDREYLQLISRELGDIWIEEAGQATVVCTSSGGRLYVVDGAPSPTDRSPPSTSQPLPIVNGANAIVRQIAGELDWGLRMLGV